MIAETGFGERERERDKIVAWLLSWADEWEPSSEMGAEFLRIAAQKISRGEHEAGK